MSIILPLLCLDGRRMVPFKLRSVAPYVYSTVLRVRYMGGPSCPIGSIGRHKCHRADGSTAGRGKVYLTTLSYYIVKNMYESVAANIH